MPNGLGEVCQTKTVNYSVTVGPFDTPGVHQVDNTAVLTPNDSKKPVESTVTVPVTVPESNVGCTLTQGYWKTHSRSGKASKKYDDNWQSVGDKEEKTLFFKSGQTWQQVFETPSQGNQYYNLAVQYMAAFLNVANGASTTPDIKDAIDGAKALFEGVDGTKLTKEQTDLAKKYAPLLADYNEGLIGPGHCTE